MARARSAKHPKSETATETVAGGGQEGHGIVAVNKAQAVRNALAEGIEGIDEIISFAKSRHGVDIPKAQVSSYKSQIKSKAALANAPKRGRKPRAAVEGYVAPPKITPKGDGDLIDALEALKPLIAQYGVEKVRRLVEVLA